jgi:release factor glutamine methyltransferase
VNGTILSMPNLRDLLLTAETQGLTRLDAQMLLLHACEQDPLNRAWLLAHAQDPLTCEQAAVAEQYFKRRFKGEPVAYITGFKEFYGLRLNVDSRVLDPRDDTETLVDWALELFPPEKHVDVLDLGTGSGAIALAIKSKRPLTQVSATDASPDALAVASGNATKLGLAVNFIQADRAQDNWFSALGAQRFHLILSNPPYIADGDAHLPALSFEPAWALTSGADGLDAIRHIVAQAAEHLMPNGWLLLEHGYDQADAVQTLMAQANFSQIDTRKDLSGQSRCTGGLRD